MQIVILNILIPVMPLLIYYGYNRNKEKNRQIILARYSIMLLLLPAFLRLQ